MKWLILLLFPVKPVIHLEHTTRYKMYKTDNMYNLLKLDTATGVVWQVQYSVTEDVQGVWSVQWRNLSLENVET